VVDESPPDSPAAVVSPPPPAGEVSGGFDSPGVPAPSGSIPSTSGASQVRPGAVPSEDWSDPAEDPAGAVPVGASVDSGNPVLDEVDGSPSEPVGGAFSVVPLG